ncbi:hypothetical protein [Ureibacillus sp. FSL W7-1570]|uniref:hypothetical protein n=1 Tax=Ureibacillus sp. FSL W7-1570 TaxID=2954593 RepID=UPI003159FA5E
MAASARNGETNAPNEAASARNEETNAPNEAASAPKVEPNELNVAISALNENVSAQYRGNFGPSRNLINQ